MPRVLLEGHGNAADHRAGEGGPVPFPEWILAEVDLVAALALVRPVPAAAIAPAMHQLARSDGLGNCRGKSCGHSVVRSVD